ncbi:hypothetical protein DRN72_04590 [Methanosarcinales archaeon]|nr:MAG: hypothetical protein DRN72_04590 [Methanosarcinales archaeon]
MSLEVRIWMVEKDIVIERLESLLRQKDEEIASLKATIEEMKKRLESEVEVEVNELSSIKSELKQLKRTVDGLIGEIMDMKMAIRDKQENKEDKNISKNEPSDDIIVY